MSHSISGNKITLTRGDTLRLNVEIMKDGEAYKPVAGDSVRFALKRKDMVRSDGYSEFADETPLILKEVPIDTMILTIEPSDTKDLGFGKYAYDIEITFADGTVDTFIANAELSLTAEVH